MIRTLRYTSQSSVAILFALLISESAFAREWHVDVRSVTLAPTGESWGSAFPTIQEGIDAAFDDGGGEVWVRWGRYDENRLALINSMNAGSLLMRPGVDVYGGFRGDETARTQRDWHEYRTVIDGSTARDGVEPAYHVVFAAGQSRLDGFTIEGGAGLSMNDIEGWGGGVLGIAVDGFALANCIVHDNSASLGAGVFFFGGIGVTVLNSRIARNDSIVSGGGVHMISGADVDIINTVIDRNTAGLDLVGGGFGGGIVVEQGAICDVWHSVVWDNQAETGNAAAALSEASVQFRSSILWSLETLDLAEQGLATLGASFCAVQGGFTGQGNIAADPRLANPARGDFTLRLDSPCIDTAQTTGRPALTNSDFNGEPRPLRDAPDIGAFELPYIALVDRRTASVPEDGETWASSFTTIQPAIDRIDMLGGGEVWIARGTFDDDRSASREDGAIIVAQGVDVYGNFSGIESYRGARRMPDLIERDLLFTVIDGFTARGGVPAYHVVIAEGDSIISGLRITGGRATGSNTNDKNGGGLWAMGDDVRVDHCQFIDNTALGAGGAAYWEGAGRWDTVFAYSNVANEGGAIAIDGAQPSLVTNSIFAKNIGIERGGAIFATDAEVWMRHCAILDNDAGSGGGFHAGIGSDMVFENGIIRNNVPGAAAATTGIFQIRTSNRQGFGGIDNISATPQFYRSTEPYDLRLAETSPSIDGGDIDGAVGFDSKNVRRVQRILPDHGPHEHRPIVYVDRTNTAIVRNGTTWTSAFNILQDGIDAAAILRTADVWVARGTYREQRSSVIDTTDTGSLQLARDAHLYGGFTGDETTQIARDIAGNETIISGEGVRAGNDAAHVIVGADFAVVDGFTIRRGSTVSTVPHRDGGGIWLRRASTTIRNSTIELNSAIGRGGGIFNQFSDAIIENVAMTDNTAGQGGAIANDTAWMTIRHSTLVENGGAPSVLDNEDSKVYIANNIIWLNDGTIFDNDVDTMFVSRFNNLQGGVTAGSLDVSAAPAFGNLSTRNLRLLPTAPDIDAGSIKDVIPADADMLRRPQGMGPDRGAFESPDSDGDTLIDGLEGSGDPDNDGRPNFLDDDSDGDGIPDFIEGFTDTDDDDVPDFLDEDSDNDGIPDADEGPADPDGDGLANYRDLDSDNDTLSDADENAIHGTNPYLADTDNGGVDDATEIGLGTNPLDGTDDFSVVDISGDGTVDSSDIQLAINAALGIAITGDADVNNDGVVNAVDIQLVILAALGLF